MKYVFLMVASLFFGGAHAARPNQPLLLHQASPPLPFNQAYRLYQDVVSGRRPMSSLSEKEKGEVLLMARSIAGVSSCSGPSRKCRAVCEASNQLVSATQDLLTCARNKDYSDDCGMQFMDVQDAHDQYESAVSDANDDCE